MHTAMTRSFVGVRILGYEFNMVGIEEGVNIGRDPLAFDPVQMRAAFDAGRALAKQPDPWKKRLPPDPDVPTWTDQLIQKAF